MPSDRRVDLGEAATENVTRSLTRPSSGVKPVGCVKGTQSELQIFFGD